MLRFVVAATLVCASAVALVTGVGLSGEDKKDPPKVKGQLPPNWRKLDLDGAQITKIYTIQTRYREKISKLETELKKLREEERGEMFRVLTDGQKQKLRALFEGKTSDPPKEKATIDGKKRTGD
jgi:Spy/CpxP family protein refolding chaperone